MNEETPVTPINTGLAEKVRQKAEAEKARMRALMPSSATAMVEAKTVAPHRQLNEVPDNNTPPIPQQKSTGLAERNLQRIEEEKKKLLSIMPSAKLEETKIEEAAWCGTPALMKADSAKEHEPAKLNWAPVTPNEIASKYPKATAVSDLKMILNAAVQQPELAVALIGKEGTSFLVKTDKAGQFWMCQPDNSPQNFNNPGLNTDLDNDAGDDAHSKEQMTPAYRRAQFGNNTAPGPKDNPPSLYYEDIEKEFGKLIDFDLENRKVIKEKTVNEGKQKTIKLSELNGLLFNVQKELRVNDSVELEKLANSLSNAIAESVLSNSKSYDYNNFCKLVNKFVEITEGKK